MVWLGIFKSLGIYIGFKLKIFKSSVGNGEGCFY